MDWTLDWTVDWTVDWTWLSGIILVIENEASNEVKATLPQSSQATLPQSSQATEYHGKY